MGQQAQSTKRALAFQSSGHVIGQSDCFKRRPKNELSRVQDKGLIGLDLYQTRQIRLV